MFRHTANQGTDASLRSSAIVWVIEMVDNSRAGYFAFGSFCLYPLARILMRDGLVVPIGSRAFDILVALVERQGQIVSRRELMALAWPGLNVEDSNVRVQMAHLRRELHCGQNDERYIVSVAGRGYCFVASIDWHDAVESQEFARTPFRIHASVSQPSLTPARPERLLGREEDLAELTQAIEERRFVTIVGAGGVGKTTLAILAAHAMKDFERAHFVDLSSAEDGAMIVYEIASVMSLGRQVDILDTIIDDLSAHRTLLILDNCEHVLDDVAEVIGSLLKRATNVHLLATSREAFRLPGEAIYLLKPLGVPPQTGRLTVRRALAWPSVRLFVERAIDGGYSEKIDDRQAAIIGGLCRRLDGNPLAIELVASRIGTYGLSRVSELLDNPLAMSWRGSRYAPLRHQTVQSMLDWSFSGLSSADQTVLRRLSIFSREFSLDTALAVVTGHGVEDADVIGAIANLVDKSLLVFQSGRGPAQFRLSGITKTYAANKLAEVGEHALVHQRHVAYQLHVLGEQGTDQDNARELERSKAASAS